MEKKRPRGVQVLGICLILGIIPALMTIFILVMMDSYSGRPQDVPFPVLDIVMRIICILSFTFLVAGLGLLKLKNWARILTLFLSPALAFISVFAGVSSISFIPESIWFFVLIVGVISITFYIIYYLTRPKVKEQFE